MIAFTLIIVVFGASVPLFKNAISNLAITRLSSIAIIFSSFLTMNVFYSSILSDSLSIYSGFVKLSVINLSFQVLLLLLGGIILAIVTSNRYFIFPSSLKFTFNNNSFITSTNEAYLNNYNLIILFNLIGAIFLMSAGDLLTLYIAVETQSFSLYILSTLRKNSVNSASAGLKYFLIGSLASAFILLGIALLYYCVGLTNFENLYAFFEIPDWLNNSQSYYRNLPTQPQHFIVSWNFAEYNQFYFATIFAIITIMVGLLIKLGAAPFHQWTPDVYSLVPTAVTTWLVIIPKISLFILFLSIIELVIGTGNANGAGTFLDFTNQLFYYFRYEPAQYYWLPNLYFDYIHTYNLIYKFNLLYGEALLYFPNYLQMEWTNYFNSPLDGVDNYTFTNIGKYIDSIDWSASAAPYSYPYGWYGYFNTLVGDGTVVPGIVDFNWYTWYKYFSSSTFLVGTGWANSSSIYSHLITPMSSVSIKNFLIFIAILSLIIGAIGGLYQIKIKRLLAFSAINHIGFLIIALCINNKVSLESFIFYLTQYSLTTLNIFLILIAFGYLTYIYPSYGKANTNNSQVYSTETLDSQNQNLDINYIAQLTNLFNNNPMLTLSFVISLFSIAGTPPLLGFFAKQQVLLSALSVGFIFVSIIAINMSVVSAVYYLKLIQVSSFINSNIPSTLKNMLLIANKKQELQLNNEIQKANNSNIINSIASTPVGAYTNLNLTFNFSNIHTYLISILTLIILLYTLKPTLLLNLTYILSSYSYIL